MSTQNSPSDNTEDPPLRPSDVDAGLGWFDRLATRVSDTVARAWFFFACLLLVVLWVPSYWLVGSLDTWQLIINTVTTIITFLLVALLQNTQSRADKAGQRKLNAIDEALIDILERQQDRDRSLRDDITELRAAIGLEQREGS